MGTPPSSSPSPTPSLAVDIARVFDDCRPSVAIHPRKLKHLSSLLSQDSFPPSFVHALTPLFDAPCRGQSAERLVRFVASFAAATWEGFLLEFVRFLVGAARAANKNARLRACQILAQIIMRLPDDADVSDDVWDEVIEVMKQRMVDKVPSIRVFAVQALSRFAYDVDNTDIIDLFLEVISEESNIEVRKAIVYSMPATAATSVVIIDRTLDVSESVRKAAYKAIATKIPLQSLSIKLRTTILQRGLMDRSSSVRAECLKMLTEDWLAKSCSGDLIALLRFLDVETYESVGEAVINALLNAGTVQSQESQNIKQIIAEACYITYGKSAHDAKLIEPEAAIYWRILCAHLQSEAQAKGSVAAKSMGAEAAVYASQASLDNDLLDDLLPMTVSCYVDLVKAHLAAGPNYRFTSRQLLLLGGLLDFSDFTNRKSASLLVQDLLNRSVEHETGVDGNKIVIGDGINLGGNQAWAGAVSELAKKVHASTGEFEEVFAVVIQELASPCRERTADFLQWMHCLAVIGLFLENVGSLRCLQGKAIEPTELLNMLLSGAKHVHIDVQRVAIRCLSIFGRLEKRPSENLVKQLQQSFIGGPTPISIMACKALMDLLTWHGPLEVDGALSLDEQRTGDGKCMFVPVDMNANGDSPIGLLDLLYSGFDRSEWLQSETGDLETVQAILGEGFAKILLLSANYPSISASLHPTILSRLVRMYFTSETQEFERLKQCLSTFFEHYSTLSAIHKKYVSRAFIPVMRSMWPGIHGNVGGSGFVVSKMRKRAIQAAFFMLQMMESPVLSDLQVDQSNDRSPDGLSGTSMSPLHIDSAEEGLAIRIAAEVTCCSSIKKTAAGKSYILALCRIVTSLNFRSSEQDAIKCMLGLLNCMIESASADKELMKDLVRMGARLRALDEHPEEAISQEKVKAILASLELEDELDNVNLSATLPPTPAAPRSTKVSTMRRRAREVVVSDDEAAVDATPMMVAPRSQRASKTVAMSRLTASARALACDSESEDDGASELSSQDDSYDSV